MATDEVQGTHEKTQTVYETRYAVFERVGQHWRVSWNCLGEDGEKSSGEVLEAIAAVERAGWMLMSFIDRKQGGKSPGLDIYFRREVIG